MGFCVLPGTIRWVGHGIRPGHCVAGCCWSCQPCATVVWHLCLAEFPGEKEKGLGGNENQPHQRVPRPVQRKALLAALLGARLPQRKVGSHGEEIDS